MDSVAAAKISETLRQRWADPEYRQMMLAARDETTRRKIAAAARRQMANPAMRAKIGDAVRRRWEDDSDFRARITEASSKRVGSLAGNWRGGLAYSATVHKWLNKTYPRNGFCEECGREGKTHYAFLHHPERHTRERNDYRELCPKCHSQMDRQ